MKIAITGAAGFIGARLKAGLEAEGHDVAGLDLAGKTPVDIEDRDALVSACAGCGAIYHLAAAHRDDIFPRTRYYDVNVQGTLGLVPFRKGYEYPMQQIPQSYLDLWLTKHLQGLTHDMAGEELSVNVVSVPAGRNGMPNPNYMDPRTKTKQHPKGLPYQPKGAPYDSRLGQRCEGNSSCVPICPVMAKYKPGNRPPSMSSSNCRRALSPFSRTSERTR